MTGDRVFRTQPAEHPDGTVTDDDTEDDQDDDDTDDEDEEP